MKQKVLILKLLIGIVLGIFIGTYSAKWDALTWIIRIIIFGESILKDLIQFFLPLIMITFLSIGIADLGSKASRLIKFTLSLSYLYTIIACTLGASAIYVYFKFFPFLTDVVSGKLEARELPSNLINLKIPFPFSESLITSMVLGFILGFGLTWTKASTIMKILKEGREISFQMIKKIVIPIIPIYICCVFALISYKGELWPNLPIFGQMILVIVLMQWAWIILQFGIAGLYIKRNPFPVIKTMFPAYLTAFGTTSSAVAMPVSLDRGKLIPSMKSEVADFIFPICSQIHLSGSAMAITISSITVSIITTQSSPKLISLFFFIFILSAIEIGAVGIPGGSIIAAWPVLTGILGFGDEALGLMFALFIIQDSFGTSANIIGDASIAMIVNRKSNSNFSFK